MKKPFSSIRSRISLFYIVTLIPLSLAAMLVFLYSSQLLRSAQALFDQNLYLEQLNTVLLELDAETQVYLNIRDDEALRNFYVLDSRLNNLLQALPSSPSSEPELLNLHLLRRLLEQYRREVGEAVNARRGRLTERYSQFYENSRTVIDYINLMVLNINWLDFRDNLQQYLAFSQWYNQVQFWALLVLLGTALFCLILISFFSLQLSLPLMRLSDAARRFGEGNFEVRESAGNAASREVRQLTETFNTMKSSISRYIEELKETATIRQDLMEKNIQNLHMKHVLRTAELIALQNQIQPHFLFNTLNTGMQLALVEDAGRTVDYLAHLAEVYRYNLRKADAPVSLGEELKSLESYIYVLRIRFGDRIGFVLHAEDDCQKLLVPPLILQPLVENAVNHGLREMTEGGLVEISAGRNGDRLHLSVQDNGRGMEEEFINKILRETLDDDPLDLVIGDQEGIGLTNVLQRIRLFFGSRATIQIEPRSEGGTNIRFILPLKENRLE